MVMAKLHIICGNCGCNDMFEWDYNVGDDLGDEDTTITCKNCSTIHSLNDNAERDTFKNDTSKTRVALSAEGSENLGGFAEVVHGKKTTKIPRYTIETHGDVYALYRGRDNTHHGLNLCHLSEFDYNGEETRGMIVGALNRDENKIKLELLGEVLSEYLYNNPERLSPISIIERYMKDIKDHDKV